MEDPIVAKVADRYRAVVYNDFTPASILREIQEAFTDPEFKRDARMSGLDILSASEDKLVVKIPNPPRGHGALVAVPDFIFELDLKFEEDPKVYGAKLTVEADITYEPTGATLGHIGAKTLSLKLHRSHLGLTYGKQLVQYLMVGMKANFKALYKALEAIQVGR